jgi:hypothetical protein
MDDEKERQLEELVIELAVQRDRAEEGSPKYNEAIDALERLVAMHPKLVPHMLEEYLLNRGDED